MQIKIVILNENNMIVQYEGITYNVTDDNCFELSKKLIQNKDNPTEIYSILIPEYKKNLEEINKIESQINAVKTSKILTYSNYCYYWKDISELSLPDFFVTKILEAEENNDEILLESYKNFWTLLSLNTDEACRINLFKFLYKWGMRISRSGFFVGYRNVSNTSEKDIYTDKRTHTFKIKIGEMVVMDKDKCDSDSSVSCSRGLHIGGESWLNQYYFGDVGLVCLVNPTDVVAVPMEDQEYGKLRCCAYLPVSKATFDENGKVIPYYIEDGFECNYVHKVIYEGIMGTEEDSPYKIKIPCTHLVKAESIQDRLLEIAKNNIINRVI